MATVFEPFDEATCRHAVEIIRAHAVTGDVHVVVPVEVDEAVFVVGTNGVVPEASLTRALTTALGRKVWVTTDAGVWGDRLRLISPGA